MEKKSKLIKRLENGVLNINDMNLAVQKYGLGLHEEDATLWDRYKYHIYLMIALATGGIVVSWVLSPLLGKVFFFLAAIFALRLMWHVVFRK